MFQLDFEEERDLYAIRIFMRKYEKLWRHMFSKYANTGYAFKRDEFSELQDKLHLINMSEIYKMLRDHNIGKEYISKDELGQLMRLINVKMHDKRE